MLELATVWRQNTTQPFHLVVRQARVLQTGGAADQWVRRFYAASACKDSGQVHVSRRHVVKLGHCREHLVSFSSTEKLKKTLTAGRGDGCNNSDASELVLAHIKVVLRHTTEASLALFEAHLDMIEQDGSIYIAGRHGSAVAPV